MNKKSTQKNYCCLYHFTAGKKDKGSTPCSNQAANQTSLNISGLGSIQGSFVVEAKKHEMNFRNHDLNSIQNKKSLPKRLCYPRVYVEQVTPKNGSQSLSSLTYSVFTQKKQFQQIFLMFKKFARLTNFKSQQQIIKAVKSNSNHRSIATLFPKSGQEIPQYFYSRDQFMRFLVQFRFGEQEAQQFWQIAFNKNRFQINGQKGVKDSDQVISMRAFAYNYRKFYLDQMQSFSNCLSSKALRQRMIDLRLLLQPWFKSNIKFKDNYKVWKVIELKICQKLNDLKEEDLYMKMIEIIEMRNKIWLFMRTLAKIFYVFTDQKNIGLDVFNQKATNMINDTKQNLEIFANFFSLFQDYLFTNGKDKNDLFKITDLVQFAKQKFHSNIDKIVHYLRSLFKYLYFFNKSELLQLNMQTLNLDCTGIAEITYNDLLEFISFKNEEKNIFIETIQSICNQINEIVSRRPQINGVKQFINQCNYLSEGLLKMIKRCDFSVFYRLQLIRQLFKNEDIEDLNQIKRIIQEKNIENQEISKQFWKKTFMFLPKQESHPFLQITVDQNHFNHFQQALLSYKHLHQQLQKKYPKVQEKKTQAKKIEQQNKTLSKKQNIVDRKESNKISINEKTEIKVDYNCGGGQYSMCDTLSSNQIESSLNKIDKMSSYLMELLQDI